MYGMKPEDLSISSLSKVASRKAKQPVAETSKDVFYWQRRAKNNESARRSRESKKRTEMDLRQRLVLVEDENACLVRELVAIKKRFGLDPRKAHVPVDSETEVTDHGNAATLAKDEHAEQPPAPGSDGIPKRKRKVPVPCSDSDANRVPTSAAFQQAPSYNRGLASYRGDMGRAGFPYVFPQSHLTTPSCAPTYGTMSPPNHHNPHLASPPLLASPGVHVGLPQRHSPLRGYTPPDVAYMPGFYPMVPGAELPTQSLRREFKMEPGLDPERSPPFVQTSSAENTELDYTLPGQDKLICDMDALPRRYAAPSAGGEQPKQHLNGHYTDSCTERSTKGV